MYPSEQVISKSGVYLTLSLILLATWFWFLLPDPLFQEPYSGILLDEHGQLLQARIASDGQWRFPEEKEVPEKFAKAITTFEDKRFKYHFGVDPIALGRAIWVNIKHNKILSGGSTISMQVIRLSRKRHRNFRQKLYEMLLAFRLEFTYSKKSILALYANHAPFGGNVVGLNAAAWRYFGRDPNDLSWGEAASLAVLPNSPSLVRPDKNRSNLLKKRNHLLDQLQSQKIIDATTCKLAKLEPIPEKPLPLPEIAPHLLNSLMGSKVLQPQAKGPVYHSTLQRHLQQQVNTILTRQQKVFAANGINNTAAIVMEVESGNVIAYAGNVYLPSQPETDSYVDMIPAQRSPGSTLKPLLYAAMLQDGLMLPHSLVADIPTQVAGYTPQNYDLGFDGAVPADKALARSLNVPAVRMLQQYRIERFYELIKKLGIKGLNQPAGHYGLSMILGGGENSMFELAGTYAGLARTLKHFGSFNGHYNPNDIAEPHVVQHERAKVPDWKKLPTEAPLNAGALYCMFNAMQELLRPGEEMLWNQFNSSRKIAWKTGTSFGFRDGWAVGITPENVVVVWVGNADGEGRPGLTGLNTAAPLLFEIFRCLPPSGWFEPPYDNLVKVKTCSKSGYLAGPHCEFEDSVLTPPMGAHTPPCPYHQLVHLDASGKYRVDSDCESPSRMQHRLWFVLPPVMEWFYKSHNSDYQALPPWKKDCLGSGNGSRAGNPMELIYPKKSNSLYVPIDLDGKTGKTVFELAHRNMNTTVFWHLDGKFIGSTKQMHQMGLNPGAGKHVLVLVDENGERLEQAFEVVGK